MTQVKIDVPDTPILSFFGLDHLMLPDLIAGTLAFGEVGAGKTSPDNEQGADAGFRPRTNPCAEDGAGT